MRYRNHKRNTLILKTVLILIVFAILYFFAAQGTESADAENIVIEDIFPITEADRYTGTENAVQVLFDASDEDYIIDKGGRYLLSGNLRGTLYIDVEDQHVHLLLDNVSIVGSSGPAISVLSAGKVFITSLNNTVNSLGDSAAYETGRTENACIYSTTDLTLNGTGKLLITGLHKDAVYCRDTLKILCSNLKVQSKRDCIRGNDGVLIQGNNIELEAERNGIRTTNSGRDPRGDVEIRGTSFSVIAGSYCVVSKSDCYVHQSDCFFNGILGTYAVAGEVLSQGELLSSA